MLLQTPGRQIRRGTIIIPPAFGLEKVNHRHKWKLVPESPDLNRGPKVACESSALPLSYSGSQGDINMAQKLEEETRNSRWFPRFSGSSKTIERCHQTALRISLQPLMPYTKWNC